MGDAIASGLSDIKDPFENQNVNEEYGYRSFEDKKHHEIYNAINNWMSRNGFENPSPTSTSTCLNNMNDYSDCGSCHIDGTLINLKKGGQGYPINECKTMRISRGQVYNCQESVHPTIVDAFTGITKEQLENYIEKRYDIASSADQDAETLRKHIISILDISIVNNIDEALNLPSDKEWERPRESWKPL